MNQPTTSRPDRWRRRCWFILVLWLTSTFLLSFNPIRAIVMLPLVVSEDDAAGEAAYVMADGYAYDERLRAASDLYHMHRINRILILQENQSTGWDFIHHRQQTVTEHALRYLVFLGVPEDKVSTIEAAEPHTLGSLSEARGVAEQEKNLNSIVVVTSAPHTRRSKLCFDRSMPDHVQVSVFSATKAAQSAEIDAPIWLEYVKLLVYFVVA